MDQVSHQITRPRIKVKITGTSTLDLTLVAWKVAEGLWKDYGIDLLVEDDPLYLVNPTAGIYYGEGLVELRIETGSGTPKVYTLYLDDPEELEGKLEDFVLGVLLRGDPVISERAEDPVDIDRPEILEVGLA